MGLRIAASCPAYRHTAPSAYDRGGHDRHRHQHRRGRVLRRLDAWATTPARSRTRPPSTSPAASTEAIPSSMFAAARLALEHGLAIGAHPGLPDLVGFGRRAPARHARAGLRRRRLPGGRARRRARRARRRRSTTSSCTARSRRTRARIPPSPTASLRAVRDIDPALPIVVMPGSQLARAAVDLGHPSVAEALPGARLRARRPARPARHPGRRHHRRRRGRAPRRAHGGRGRRSRRSTARTVVVPPAHALHPRRQPARREHRRRRPRRAGGRRSRAGGVLSRAAARRLRPPRRPHRSRGQRGDPAPRRGACSTISTPGVTDVQPSYTTLYVEYDARRAERADIERWMSGSPRGRARGGGVPAATSCACPCVYDGEDIAAVCEATGLARHELIDLHSGRDYRVFAVGASPGFPFLGVLDERLRMARRPSPRSARARARGRDDGAADGHLPGGRPGRLAAARPRAARGLRPLARAAVPDRAGRHRAASSPRRARSRPSRPRDRCCPSARSARRCASTRPGCSTSSSTAAATWRAASAWRSRARPTRVRRASPTGSWATTRTSRCSS